MRDDSSNWRELQELFTETRARRAASRRVRDCL